MRGICGFLPAQPYPDGHKLRLRVLQMAEAIPCLNSDVIGTWVCNTGKVALGHRRRAAIDGNPASHQSLHPSDCRFIVILNGEIDNADWLKKKLIADTGFYPQLNGHFATEILRLAIEQYGIVESLKMVSGAFSLAVWDQKSRELTVARDQMGQKPLYYGTCAEGVLIASDLASFKAFGREHWQIDDASLALYFRHNYIPAPHSIFKNVYKLEPGCFLTVNTSDRFGWRNTDLISLPYWEICRAAREQYAMQAKPNMPEHKTELENLLGNALKKQMQATAPLGAFLSGGIDSSLICAIMQSVATTPLKTFTVAFDEERFNESNQAQEIARHLATEHTELLLTQKMALDIVPTLSQLYSEPFGDSSQIPSILISRLAKQSVTAALTGDGGDELFGGYARYFQAEKIFKLLGFMPQQARQRLTNFLSHGKTRSLLNRFGVASSEKTNRVLHKIIALLPSESYFQLYKTLVSHTNNPTAMLVNSCAEPLTRLDAIAGLDFLPSNLEKIMFTDLLSYLPDDILVKVDRTFMSTGLETRMPFLDPNIVAFSWRLPLQEKVAHGHGKQVLRQLLLKYLPPRLLSGSKKGFAIPAAAWLRGELKDWGAALLEPTRLAREGLLNKDLISRLWQDHQSTRAGHERMLWNILMLQSWLENWKS